MIGQIDFLPGSCGRFLHCCSTADKIAVVLCFAVHVLAFALLIPCVQIMRLVQASRSCSLRITTCVNTMVIHVNI